MKSGSAVAVLLGMLVWGQLAVAQVATGSISGVVQDETGAVVPGATVIVRNTDTGISRTLTTGPQGRYQALNLNPGSYQVEGQLQGFQRELRSGITIAIGRAAVVNLSMRVGAVTEIVEVTGEAPLIETTNATLGNLVDQQTIESMPLNGRSWDQLALLQTGVTPYAGGSTKSFGGNTTGQKFSVAGSRNYSNSFLLDGTDVNDHGNSTPGGAAGVNLGVDAIREFQVITNSFKAEYGRATGAVVSAVTKSGTNQFHGSLFEFHRNDELDAAEYGFFDNPEEGIVARPPFVQNQFGGSFGGPIVRDRTFFMSAYEGLRIRKGTARAPLTLSPDGKNGILGRNEDGTPKEVVEIHPRARPFVDLYPSANDPDSVAQFNDGTGTFITAPVVATREDYVLGRVDHQINDDHSIFVRYVFDDDIQAIPGSNLGIPGFTETNNSRRQYSTVQVNSILTPTVLNSFRIAYNRSAQFRNMLPDTELGPEFSFVPGLPMGLISISGSDASLSGLGLVNMGTNAMTPRFFIYNLFEYGNDLSVIRGSHTLKFGGSLKRMRDNSLNDTSRRGQYRFPNLRSFLQAEPDQFRHNAQRGDPNFPQAVGDSYRGLRQWLFAVYAQDDWQVSPRLTLNLGLRYETVTNPTEVNHLAARLVHITDPAYTTEPEIDSYFDVTKKNFQPRFGFAWQLNDSATTVLRGGTGIFHDQTLPNLYAVNVERYPPYFFQLRKSSSDFDLNFTQQDLGGVEGVVPSVSGVSPIIKTATKYHWNLSVQQEVSQNNVVEIGYVGARSHNLPKFNELNGPNPVILEDGQKCFNGSDLCPDAQRARKNRNFSQLRTTEWKFSGFYNAANLKFTHRTNTGGQFQFLYTLSRAWDSASTHATQDFRREPQNALDPTDPNRDWGRAAFDALHNVAFHYTYPIPFQGEGAMGALFGGWEVAGITSMVSGSPYLIRVGADTDRDRDGGRADRPDLRPGFSNNPTDGSSAGCQSGPISVEAGPVGNSVDAWNSSSRWHDVCAFGILNPGLYGNLGRNTLIGPGRLNFDFSAHKTFPLTENTSLQLRAEFFNLFNRNNLGLPINQGFSGDRQEDFLAASGTVSPGDTVTTPRQIQFGLRFEF